MELVGSGALTEWDLLAAWVGSGVLCWLVFVVFMRRVLGSEALKSRGMKRTGLLILVGMIFLGLLSVTIVVTAGIPYLESFLGDDLSESENAD